MHRKSTIARHVGPKNANQGLDVENPKLVFIVGCVGLGLNMISALFLHGMFIHAEEESRGINEI